MKSIKSFLALTAILCVSVLYAEENTHIKQQVAYKDQVAWMSTTAKHVGTILLFVVKPLWIRWLKSTIPYRLMHGVGIILSSMFHAYMTCEKQLQQTHFVIPDDNKYITYK